MGHAVRLISAEKPDLVRSVVVTCVCGNSGVIPLAIMAGMCASSGPLGSEAECENKDAYIFIYTTISNLIMWSWGFVEMVRRVDRTHHSLIHIARAQTHTHTHRVRKEVITRHLPLPK